VKAGLVADSERIAGHLGLVDGVFHLQYLQNGSEFSIIEITRRCSGDLYPYPVNIATGLRWEDWIVKAEAGADCSGFPNVSQEGYCGRHCLMADRNGTLGGVVVSDEIRGNIVDEVLWWARGDAVTDYAQQKFGIYTLRYGSSDEMADKTSRITDLFRVVVD